MYLKVEEKSGKIYKCAWVCVYSNLGGSSFLSLYTFCKFSVVDKYYLYHLKMEITTPGER